MKNLKFSLSVAALVLGLGTALATTSQPRFANKTWGKDPITGQYTDVTGLLEGRDFDCTGATNRCTEDYPADVNPNNQAGDAHPGTVAPVNIVPGNFSM